MGSSVVDINEVRRDRERGTSFTARKLAAVQRAMRDTEISHLDFRVYYYLVDAVDAETGLAKRKQRVIADDLRLGRRTVQESLVRLRGHGVIEFEIPEGKSNTNSYRIVVEKARDAAPFSDGKARPAAPSGNERRGTAAEKARHDDKKGAGTRAPTLPLISHEIPLRARGPSSPDGLGPAGALIRRRIGDAAFRSWFSDVVLVSSETGMVTLSTASPVKRDRLDNQYRLQILDAFQAVDITVTNLTVITSKGKPQ